MDFGSTYGTKPAWSFDLETVDKVHCLQNCPFLRAWPMAVLRE